MSEHLPELSGRVDYDDYINKLSDRLVTSPIQVHIEMLQRHYTQRIYTDEQLKQVWHSAQGLMAGFKEQALEQGLIGQIVTLEGDGIKIPRLDIDLRHGYYMVTHEDTPSLTQDTLEQYQLTHQVSGVFMGYSLMFIETAPESKQHRAQLVYQVSTGMTAETPHGPAPLYVTGVVNECALRFAEDERRDNVAEAASRLYELVPRARINIHRIIEEMLVDRTEEVEDASLLRHLGHHADRILAHANRDAVIEVSDLVESLVSQLIAEKQKGELLAGEYTRQFDDVSREREVCGSDEDAYFIDGEVQGAMFLQLKDQKNTRLNMVLGRPGEVVFVPMVAIDDYSRKLSGKL